jgi:8-oxo-dGTP diphosphatase
LVAMNKNELKRFLLKGQDTFLKHLSVDCVIFGFHDNQLKVLLVKWTEGWSIPGGFIRKDESIKEAAKKSLEGTYRT